MQVARGGATVVVDVIVTVVVLVIVAVAVTVIGGAMMVVWTTKVGVTVLNSLG